MVLAAAYHERREVESTADAVKTPQADRRPAPPVRPPEADRPREVAQEVYGLLLAHLAVRLTMAEAAAVAGVAPGELSFTGTLRILRRAVAQCQRGQMEAAELPFPWTGC